VPDPILWSEGMLLHPQHFQQAWLRQDGLLFHHLSRVAPFHYGVSRMEIDRGALAAGRFRILALEAVMPDGLLVWDEGSGALPDLDLVAVKDKLLAPMRIHLVVPAWRPGSARADDDLARWRTHPGAEVVDENTGQDAEPVPRLRPALRLRLADDLPPRSVTLPLAEVEFKNHGIQLTPYEPPTATLGPDSALARDCRSLVQKLREKAVYVAESRSRDIDRGEARHTVWCLSAGLPGLETLLRLPTVHPFDLYMALQAVTGQTATLRPAMIPPLTDPYDHLDPRGCIGALLARIGETVDLVAQAFSALSFQAAPNGFQHRLEPERAGKDLIVGLRLKPGQKAEDAVRWMEAAMITVAPRLEELVSYRLRGAGRVALTEAEAGTFAGGRDVVLYRIAPDDFVVAGETLLIVNPLDRAGTQRPADILLFTPMGAGAA
jgi:type VI secretion system protein ImpJ